MPLLGSDFQKIKYINKGLEVSFVLLVCFLFILIFGGVCGSYREVLPASSSLVGNSQMVMFISKQYETSN